jgi:nucleoside-diphosphate-sugar epimerase
VEPVWCCEFGSDRFLDLVRDSAWDLLCHHASEMTEYRSWDFDLLAASQANTKRSREILTTLRERWGTKLVYTGTVFEPYEGLGEAERRAFSPYGLAKHVSFEILRLEAERVGVAIGKFVIPNPFGPYEEFKFTGYLAREWAANRTPTVMTPAYIRDNIHVDLLARCYRRFCDQMAEACGVVRCSPSGYIEAQGTFAQRFAREFGSRLGRHLEVNLEKQTEFAEPVIRVNSFPAAIADQSWSEAGAWDELIRYYQSLYSG